MKAEITRHKRTIKKLEEGDRGQKSGRDSTTAKPLALKNWCTRPDHVYCCFFEYTHTHMYSYYTTA